jgi:hypothetical protein
LPFVLFFYCLDDIKRIVFDKKVITALARSGLKDVFLGIESASEATLKRMRKGVAPSKSAESVQMLRSLGIEPNLGFIMFEPDCVLADVRLSLAFLNENNYTIYNSIKKYDLVIDSAFHEYKNVNIAKKLQNTIHIGYFKYSKRNTDDKVVPNFGTLANFTNVDYKKLEKPQINIYYNQSLIGGIFSECEGACFASSQYLLCGLPVISIKSVGNYSCL